MENIAFIVVFAVAILVSGIFWGMCVGGAIVLGANIIADTIKRIAGK